MTVFQTFIISILILLSTGLKAEYSQMQKRIDEKEKLNNQDQPYSFHQFMNQKKEQNQKNKKENVLKENRASKKSADKMNIN